MSLWASGKGWLIPLVSFLKNRVNFVFELKVEVCYTSELAKEPRHCRVA